MKQRDYASGQSLKSTGTTLLEDKSKIFRKKWCQLVRSPLYLLFAIQLTSAILSGLIMVLNNMIPGLNALTSPSGMTQADKLSLIINLGILIVLWIPGAINTLGVWLIYRNARDAKEDEMETTGISIIMWVHRIFLALVGVAFVITLPALTEWMPYNPDHSVYIQLAYLAYVLFGLYSAAVMIVTQRMKEKMTVWNSADGPLMPLLVVFLLGYIALMTVITVGLLNIFYIFAVEACVLLVVLLWKYEDAVNRL